MNSKYLITLLILIISSYSAFADNGINIIEDSVSISGIVGETISGSFIIDNTGDTTLDVTFYNLTLTKDSETVILVINDILSFENQTSVTVNFDFSIPAEQSIGMYTGIINATGVNASGTTASDLVTIDIEVLEVPFENKLEIIDLDINVKYLDENSLDPSREDVQHDVQNDSTLEVDVFPESEVEFTIEVENIFDEDIEIYNVFVRVIVDGIDNGGDIEVETDELDLEYGEDEIFNVTIKIPSDVESDDYEVTIEAVGEDENNDEHSVFYKLTMDVKKEDHDLKISKSQLSQNIVECDRNLVMTGEIENLGSQQETLAGIGIKNLGLGIDFIQENIILEDLSNVNGNKYEYVVSKIISDGVSQGDFDIVFTAYLNNVIYDTETETVTIVDCEVEEEPEEEIEEGTDVQIDKPRKNPSIKTTSDGTRSGNREQIKPQKSGPPKILPILLFLLVIGILGGATFFILKSRGYFKPKV